MPKKSLLVGKEVTLILCPKDNAIQHIFVNFAVWKNQRKSGAIVT